MSKLGQKLISAIKDGQTHEFKAGYTMHPDHRIRNDDGELMYVKDKDQICQATFKEHCQYPKCDCDRPVADILDAHVTDPSHGGKVTCHKCNGFIQEKDHEGYWDFTRQVKSDFPMYSFHKDCYNPYEHYYGLDKGID